jgi:hypothetical protein
MPSRRTGQQGKRRLPKIRQADDRVHAARCPRAFSLLISSPPRVVRRCSAAGITAAHTCSSMRGKTRALTPGCRLARVTALLVAPREHLSSHPIVVTEFDPTPVAARARLRERARSADELTEYWHHASLDRCAACAAVLRGVKARHPLGVTRSARGYVGVDRNRGPGHGLGWCATSRS